MLHNERFYREVRRGVVRAFHRARRGSATNHEIIFRTHTHPGSRTSEAEFPWRLGSSPRCHRLCVCCRPWRLEKVLARVAREQGLDQERLRRWVCFLALCEVLEHAVERGVIDTYYLKGGVAMELRFAGAARTTKDFDLGLEGNRTERIRRCRTVDRIKG
jgi:hypothetical protein